MHRGWSAPVSLADCGTGSGILALYAHVRGCPSIEACDIHEPSVVANMTGTELTESLAGILSVWTRAEPLVLSGMRANEVEALIAAVPATAGLRQTLGAFTAIAFTTPTAR
jgi:hypothetical protein